MLQIAGANGSGKTSLIKILCGLVAPDRGRVLWRQADIRIQAHAYRSSLIYVGHKDGIKGGLSTRENLCFAAALANSPADPDPSLKRWGLADARGPCRLLSAGQRQRLALARLSLVRACLWILDEPLTALDAAGKALLGEAVGEHLGSGGTVVMSSHQRPDWPVAMSDLRLGA